ncbi:MAG: MCP four helix bundle domain-containing protein, partial [Bacteroidota bacterium]
MQSNRFFSLRRVGHQVMFTFGVIIILYILNIAYNLSGINTLDDSVQQIYRDRMLSISSLLEADRDCYQSSIALSHLLLRSDDRQQKSADLFAGIEDNLLQVKERFEGFKSIHYQSNGGDHPAFQVFSESYQEVEKITRKLTKLYREGSILEMRKIYFSEYATQFQLMRNAMDQLTEVSYSLAETNYKANQAKSEDISSKALLFFLTMLLVMTIAGLLLIRRISKQLGCEPFEAALIARNLSKGILRVDFQKSREQGLFKDLKDM